MAFQSKKDRSKSVLGILLILMRIWIRFEKKWILHVINIFNSSDLDLEREKISFYSFAPIGSGSVEPYIFSDPDPKHCLKWWYSENQNTVEYEDDLKTAVMILNSPTNLRHCCRPISYTMGFLRYYTTNQNYLLCKKNQIHLKFTFRSSSYSRVVWFSP